jgi:hypothetical protein
MLSEEQALSYTRGLVKGRFPDDLIEQMACVFWLTWYYGAEADSEAQIAGRVRRWVEMSDEDQYDWRDDDDISGTVTYGKEHYRKQARTALSWCKDEGL